MYLDRTRYGYAHAADQWSSARFDRCQNIASLILIVLRRLFGYRSLSMFIIQRWFWLLIQVQVSSGIGRAYPTKMNLFLQSLKQRLPILHAASDKEEGEYCEGGTDETLNGLYDGSYDVEGRTPETGAASKAGISGIPSVSKSIEGTALNRPGFPLLPPTDPDR